MSRNARAHEIQASIREVLANDWDPIGVARAHNLPDEYDSYVGGVYRLLASGTSATSLAAHLEQIELQLMSLTSTPESNRSRTRAVERLMSLNVSLTAP